MLDRNVLGSASASAIMPAGWIVKIAPAPPPVGLETDWTETLAIRVSDRSEALFVAGQGRGDHYARLWHELSEEDVERLGLQPREVRRIDSSAASAKPQSSWPSDNLGMIRE